METVILNNMDKLLSPIEQAELVGILKKPEELIYEQKRHYFFSRRNYYLRFSFRRFFNL